MEKMGKEGSEFVLAAIDESIRKWFSVAISRDWNYGFETKCPLCKIYNKQGFCEIDEEIWEVCEVDEEKWKDWLPEPFECPIKVRTGYSDCMESPFYRTSLWFKSRDLKCEITPTMRKADNQMLILLYEVRREQVLFILRER